MKYVPCNLCGADDWVVRFPATVAPTAPFDVDLFRCTAADYGDHAQIVSCVQCGYVYANPRWEAHELIGAYATVEDETYVAEREGRELTFQKHLQSLQRFTGPGRGRALLDVGAYIGVFVDVARRAGWDAIGVEPSTWAVDQARRADLPVIAGTLNAPELAGHTFDAITMWDVIEHVDDPARELAKAHALLNPGGFIAVHTMDIDSLAARLMGKRWPWLMSMHIHFFSQSTLRKMLTAQGFEVVWSGPQGRYLRLGYVASRLGGLHQGLGRIADRLITRLGWQTRPIPLNFGDLITVFARKPFA